MPLNESLMLKNLPMWSCCDHCMEKYCPEGLGHYVPCPDKNCVLGHGRLIGVKR